MATYAMICNNRVIEVLYSQEVPPIWPPDPVGSPVTAVECPDEATRDWSYNPETGEVYDPVYDEAESVYSEPTQLDRIESAVNKSNEELRQEGADALTEELIESGLI